MKARIWAAIVIAAFGYGTNGVATRAALIDGVPPVALVAIRSVLAVLVLTAILLIRRDKIEFDRDRWTTGLIAGVFQLSLPFILFTLAYERASAGFVGLLVALIPLGTAVAAHYLLPDEPLHTAKVVGLAVAFGGVALLLVSGDSGLSDGGEPLSAAFFTIGAVLCISFATVYVRGRAGSFDAIELSFMQFFVGVFVVGGAMLVVEGIPTAISTWGWLLIIYTTTVGAVIPTLLFYWLLQRVSSTKASLVGYVIPFIALVAGILLLDEKLQAGIAVGGVLILIGVVLTDRAETLHTATDRVSGS